MRLGLNRGAKLSPTQPSSERNLSPTGFPDLRARSFRERVSAVPTVGFVIVTVTLLVATPLGTWGLIALLPQLLPAEPLIESGLNVGVVLPMLLWLFVVPAARNLRQRDAAELALRSERAELEVKVRERTAELEASNQRLRQEAKERAEAQRAIAFQASLLDAVEQSVVAIDDQGRIRYWNRFTEDFYGCPASVAHGRYLRDIVTFIGSGGERLGTCTKGAGRSSWSGEAQAIRTDGVRMDVHLEWSPLPGDHQGCVYVSFDVAEAKRAREALQESEESYSSVVEGSPTGIFILQNERLCFVNPKLSEILGYPLDELLGSEPWELVHPDDRERVSKLVHEEIEGTRAPEECECRLITKSGRERWVAIQNSQFRYDGGPAILGNVQDVTERKRMEGELHQLSARLLRIQEEERHRVARDLHDSLGQKLTGIKFLVEASLGPPWPKERRSGVLKLRELVPTIQDAVEELRRISTELRPSVLDDLGLIPTIAWYLREFSKAHPELNVVQRLTTVESEVPVALRTPIFRILQEATNNAAKHSRATQLTVGLETLEGRLRFWVSDNGAGFDQTTPVASVGQGGFGRSSMRERAELSGGAFSVRSAPGLGTTVQANWPVERAASG